MNTIETQLITAYANLAQMTSPRAIEAQMRIIARLEAKLGK